MLGSSIMMGMADSVWTGSVLAAFIYRLSGGSNAVVGYVEAASGMTTLFLGLPLGYIADVISKSKVIIGGGIVMLFAVAFTTVTVWEGAKYDHFGNSTNASNHTNNYTTTGYYEDYYSPTDTASISASFSASSTLETDHDEEWFGPVSDALAGSTPRRSAPAWTIWLLGFCMCLWGAASAIANGPSQALFADSLDTGDRSKWFTYTFILYLAGSVLGPTIAIIIFKTFGNHWTLRELRNVFMAGLVLELLTAPFMFMFRDIPKEKDADGKETGEEGGDGGGSGADDGDAVKESRKSSCCGLFTYKSIPKVLFAQGVVMSLGSGMTVKFFPLFFQNDMKFNPTQVQGVYLAVPIAMALLSGLATMISKKIGRVPTIITFDIFGISCLVCMVLLKSKVSPLMLAVIYIVRTGLMNSTYPLANSIMMDCCPTNQRARWKSLESIMTFGWCGSAALGGYIADRHSYDYTFLITAALQFTSVMMLVPLLALVPSEVQKPKSQELKPVYEGDDAAAEDAPLLSVNDNSNNNSDNVYE